MKSIIDKFRVSEIAILTILLVLDFDFDKYQPFKLAKFDQYKDQELLNSQNDFFDVFHSPESIPRKNPSGRKILKFLHCGTESLLFLYHSQN